MGGAGRRKRTSRKRWLRLAYDWGVRRVRACRAATGGAESSSTCRCGGEHAVRAKGFRASCRLLDDGGHADVGDAAEEAERTETRRSGNLDLHGAQSAVGDAGFLEDVFAGGRTRPVNERASSPWTQVAETPSASSFCERRSCVHEFVHDPPTGLAFLGDGPASISAPAVVTTITQAGHQFHAIGQCSPP